ncbi:unnamed protein product [Dicrocoelium dendriticum]|nr:unnamed protein product [Dicrocoelium dendriticum]
MRNNSSLDKKFYVYGDVSYLESKKEKVLYISNHLSTADWFICCMLTARQGNMGRCKFILHKNLKYIPIFGLYLAQDSCIFVDRSNFQESKAVNAIQNIRAMQSKAWIAIYPEGRRYNPQHFDAIAKSREFAKSLNIQPYRFHLTPRTRGFRLLLDHLRDYFDAVYDISVVYADKNGYPLDRRKRMPQLTDWLNSYHTLHVHIRRLPIQHVPHDGEKIDAWIHDLFHIKDEFLSNIQENFHGDTTELAGGDISANSGYTDAQTNGSLTGEYSMSIQQQLVRCMPPKMDRTAKILKPMTLVELVPSVIFFYGLTFYWIFGFGWYGPISFIGIALFGSMLGELYVHYWV